MLDAPSDIDRFTPFASAHQLPAARSISARMMAIGKPRLTPLAIASHADTVAPAAGAGTVTTYTPAQIRAAYGLPPLPASWANLSASEAAKMGAGQTIYVIAAMGDPNIAAELAAFNQKFGLPACTTTTISPTASLPLAPASGNGCQFSEVYATSNGKMTSTAPAYDSGWATEIALDVQWAHATAPLARIILIESPNAYISSLVAAINLANSMGPGVVSMSFGANEGNWTSSVDASFTSANMTYVAATGDDGAGVMWPAVSRNVLAVSGTSLTYNGATRTETVWANTGGGISLYTSAPDYQTPAVPGMGMMTWRSVGDVSFNANPYTGQYVAVIPKGSATVEWYSVGGTSLGTPQWAGIVAVANAMRAQNALGRIGLMQSHLYSKISTNPTVYASAFADVTSGSNGTCGTCSARAGYDQPSGLGTPNVGSLLPSLTGSSQQAPVVSPIAVNGTAGNALLFSVAVTSPEAVNWSLSNAPQGMTISSSGQVSWPQPVAGSYAVAVKATGTTSGLSGTATATVTIAAPVVPVVAGATIVGTSGQALSYQVSVTSANPVTYSISGAPSGMSISPAGVMTWNSPVAGTYSVTVTATDTKTGLAGSARMTVQVSAAATGPVISASPITGVAGQPLSAVIGISSPGARYVNITIVGAPPGVTFAGCGQGVTVAWQNPVAGSYQFTVTTVDSNGLSSQATVAMMISAR
ncbi:MAG TPA: S53 family peptidase [Paraburkholderia sp.]|jgi:subtilase family serine protease|nr:S53 family peptidase [Paraburkholderia sp.]